MIVGGNSINDKKASSNKESRSGFFSLADLLKVLIKASKNRSTKTSGVVFGFKKRLSKLKNKGMPRNIPVTPPEVWLPDSMRANTRKNDR